MYQKFVKKTAGANFSSAMGAETIQNTRVSPKNQKSRDHKIWNFNIILSFCVILLTIFSSGCSSTQPMTKKIDRQASNVGKVTNFQYYVSRNIILTKTENSENIGKVAVKGELKVTSTKEIIQITSSTKGVLLKTEINPLGNKIYYVAFEAENDNCLRFVQTQDGQEEKIYLLYDDVKSNAINYGNAVYIVEWKGAEGLKQKKRQAKIDNFRGKLQGKLQGVTSDDVDKPYLLVKMKTKFKEKENYRKVSGRKVEVK